MSNIDRFYLAEDPMQVGGPQFVVDPLSGSSWEVVMSTDFSDLMDGKQGPVAAYRNPDSIVEWIKLIPISGDVTPGHSDAALNWYIAYLRFEDNAEPVVLKPWRNDMPDVFMMRNREGTRYALLYYGLIETAASVPPLLDKLRALKPDAHELLPGDINLIEWPAN